MKLSMILKVMLRGNYGKFILLIIVPKPADKSSSPSCKKNITKWCFIKGCFDWCFEHSAICTGNNGWAMKRIIHQETNDQGNDVARELTEEVTLCTSEEAGKYCNIFSSGK